MTESSSSRVENSSPQPPAHEEDPDQNTSEPREWSTRTRWGFRLLILMVACYFVVRVVALAWSEPPGNPPDETVHLQTVELFSKGPLAGNDNESVPAAIARITPHDPYAYFWLAGRVRHLNVFPIEDYLFLRFISVGLASLLVFYGWLALRLASDDRAVQFLGMVMLTNTIMFTYSSASVTYDVLTNTACAGAIYHTLAYWKRGMVVSLLAAIAWVLVGTLTKTSVLPFAFALFVCLVLYPLPKVIEPLKKALGDLRHSNPSTKGLAAVLLLLLGLNAELYVGNLVQFGKLTPSPNQVMSEAELLTHPAYARNFIVKAYDRGELTLDEAMDAARGLPDPTGVSSTLGLLRLRKSRVSRGESFEPISRVAYLYPWAQGMLRSTFGVLSHDLRFVPSDRLVKFWLLFGFAAISLAVQIFRRRVPRSQVLLLTMGIFYTAVLMQVVNYNSYLSMENVHANVQGRYLFPLLVPFYLLVAIYALPFRKALVRWAGAIVVAIAFIYHEFGFIVYYTTK